MAITGPDLTVNIESTLRKITYYLYFKLIIFSLIDLTIYCSCFLQYSDNNPTTDPQFMLGQNHTVTTKFTAKCITNFFKQECDFTTECNTFGQTLSFNKKNSSAILILCFCCQNSCFVLMPKVYVQYTQDRS